MNRLRALRQDRTNYDAIVIGGGPAGLSAALVLGRARRRTLVVDAGRPRNLPSPAAHGMMTRDGTAPGELMRVARRELDAYPTVDFHSGSVVSVQRDDERFLVRLDDGTSRESRRLLLAIGVRDELPPIDGVAALWGTAVLHCGYCHGWEVRDQPLALHARGDAALASAALLLGWTHDLVVLTGGPAGLTVEQGQALESHGVRLIETPLQKVERRGSTLCIAFADGTVLERNAMFLSPKLELSNSIPDNLGCERAGPGHLRVDSNARTTVPGVYAAGDIAAPNRQVIAAAASGAHAAMMLNKELALENFRSSEPPTILRVAARGDSARIPTKAPSAAAHSRFASQARKARLEIRLIGDFEVLRNGGAQMLPNSRKTRALLAYLILNPGPHRRERLCEIFWEVPDDPRGSLRWSLSKLRRLVNEPGGTRIIADRENVAFDPAGADIDIFRFRGALADGVAEIETGKLAELATIASRGLLPGVDPAGQAEFARFLAGQREVFRVMRRELLCELIQRHLSQSPGDAAHWLRELVEIEPYSVEGHALLVATLIRAGRKADAEGQLQSSLSILSEIDGIDLAAVRRAAASKPQPSASVPLFMAPVSVSRRAHGMA